MLAKAAEQDREFDTCSSYSVLLVVLPVGYVRFKGWSTASLAVECCRAFMRQKILTRHSALACDCKQSSGQGHKSRQRYWEAGPVSAVSSCHVCNPVYFISGCEYQSRSSTVTAQPSLVYVSCAYKAEVVEADWQFGPGIHRACELEKIRHRTKAGSSLENIHRETQKAVE